MFEFGIYYVKDIVGKEKSGWFFGIWGVIQDIDGDRANSIPNNQLLEWAERLNAGRAVNYYGYVIRRIKL